MFIEGSQEYFDLSGALFHIRDILTAVDMTVNRYDKGQELQEVLTRLENKSTAKLKNGKVFSKQDLCSKHRVLQHKGLVYWKTTFYEFCSNHLFLRPKPPVIPLQKLIVREVANEERGMFLISASSVGPEMYEVHTVSRDERNAWMRQIRQAVEMAYSCPEEEEEEEERNNELEGTRRANEARIQKIAQFQETLLAQDQLICNTLEEKLELYAELTELSLGSPEATPYRHLVVQADNEVPGQASTLLTAALKEGRRVCVTKMLCCNNAVYSLAFIMSLCNTYAWTWQATVNLQDSCCEVQKLLLQEEELFPLQSLNNTYVNEWVFQSEQETVLRQREQQCLLEVERLRCEREEFDVQLLEYQQNMDRLREGQRSVEREKEKIEAQQRLLQTWRHSRQSSLPVTIPLRSGSLDSNCAVFDSEKVLLTTLQQNHLYQSANNHHQCLLSATKKSQNGPLSSSGYTTNLGLTATLYNSLNTLLSQTHSRQIPDRLPYANCSHGSPQPVNESIHSFSSRASTLPPKPAGTVYPLRFAMPNVILKATCGTFQLYVVVKKAF
uniref:PH domain-containing protein n=1 Tax=Neogobius melanostomus TaxID=47308 RepID=A0A8C6SFA7_9GOBI